MQVNSLRVMLGIRRIDRLLIVHIREMCEVTKMVDERIEESVLRWFCHTERTRDDRIAERVNVEECMSSFYVGRPWKMRTDSVNDCC